MVVSFLVLFDIDGTLVHTGRAGVRGMSVAFERLYGRTGALDGVPIAGRTDRAIVSEVLARVGRTADDAAVAELRDAYLACLRDEIVRPVEHPRCVLPGVSRLLDALEARGDVALGLLTGNFSGGAAIKLGHFDLWRRFGFGAFGDVHLDRRDLVPVALDRARAAGHPEVPKSCIVVIGDTPLDVDCAQASGVRSVAVATGPFDAAALARCGADLVVESLEDPAAMAAICPAQPRLSNR